MKQLLISAYAARIKVNPQIHIKESMVHNNLGHRLPAENTSSMFKQMEQPVKHKAPSLGWELKAWICMDGTAPVPRALLKPLLRLCPESSLQGGWGGKAEPGSGTTLQQQHLQAAERCPLRLGIAQGARSSGLEWGSLGLLLLLLAPPEPALPPWPCKAESSPVGKPWLYSTSRPTP